MPAISVVVPVYNVEKYLPHCVRSLREQSFADLEIILVDDGSPDGCGALCDAYAEEDDRIRVIHKENGGLSSARNAGIEAARGRYIGFVDSDDYVEPEMYERLYTLAEKERADIAVGSYWICRGNQRKPFTQETESRVYSGREAVEKTLLGRKMNIYVSCRLVKREIFDNGLRFPAGQNFEDVYIMVDLHLAAKTVAFDDRPMYNYVRRYDSIVNAPVNERTMDAVKSYRHMMDEVKKRCPELLPMAKSRLHKTYFYIWNKLVKEDAWQKNPQYGPVLQYLKNNAWAIIRSPYLEWKRRIGMLLLYISPAMYRAVLLRKIR